MDLDFLLFQLKLLYSLTPHVPLQDNLSAVMAPALLKLKRSCGARVALHIFVNPELREVHVMAVGESPVTLLALEEELYRRHRMRKVGEDRPNDSQTSGEEPNFTPNANLPRYKEMRLSTTLETDRVFRARGGPEYCQDIAGQLFTVFEFAAKEFHAEFGASLPPRRNDTVIVIPLGKKPYLRLGYLVLWASGSGLKTVAEDPKKREDRVAFRGLMEELLERVFSNFYDMEPHTYLPSYHKAEVKAATLLCAEISDYGRISDIARRHFCSDAGQDCLRNLVTQFATMASCIVELHGGRVDQMWGNGLLAVFGEYLDTENATAEPGCRNALAAASELTKQFKAMAKKWLEGCFGVEKFRKIDYLGISVSPAVSIHHGEVMFDYIGSPKHRLYMAFGDHIDFAKQLLKVAAQVEAAYRKTFEAPGTSRSFCWLDQEFDPPRIVLSQSAHEWSKSALQDRENDPRGLVHRGHLLNLPGMHDLCPVYPIWAENVITTAVRAPSKSVGQPG